MKKHSPQELTALFRDAEQVDQELFAEMRSNILLIMGEHYAKKGSKFWNRIRDDRQLSQEQKLRLVKNHVQKIHKIYANNIVSYAPGVRCSAHNEKELRDQKAAELHQSVWVDAKARHNFDEKIMDWVDDFCGIGEVATKIFFNPNKGQLQGFEQAIDGEGQLVFDEEGSPEATGTPVFGGDLEFERLFAFNLLRSASAKSMDESPFLCVRKMVDKSDLISMVGEDSDQKKAIDGTGEETYVIFDSATGNYKESKDQVMLKEFYFRTGMQYPKGYYFVMVGEEVLWEGELPFGIFPIIYAELEKVPTSPRGRSIVKTMRPYQVEINRAASKMAEAQITLGDDKLILQNGSKMSKGTDLPGIRSLVVNGAPPTILGGRDGSQYLNYMNSQITELYQVMGVPEITEENQTNQLDPYAMLFRSASQKQKFSRYTKRFEGFLKRICETYLELKRNYASEQDLIPILGRREMVNIPEFKNHRPIDYQIKIEPQTEDIETRLGKQLSINHIIQYAGAQLGKEDIGRLAKLMPYCNEEESFADLTLDSDLAMNEILALDRGEMPQPYKYDNHEYLIKRLTTRTRQADFRSLHPQIQQNYQNLIAQHESVMQQNLQEIQAAEAGFIPTGGYMVVCDFYVSDPEDPNKTRRARLPYESIQWLIKQLETQGSSLQNLESMNQGALAEMARTHQAQGQMAQGNTEAPRAGGQANPQGVNAHVGNGNFQRPGLNRIPNSVVGQSSHAYSPGSLSANAYQ